MPHVRWKLKKFAEAHGLTGYVIAKQMVRSSDDGRPATAYRLLSDNPPARIDLGTLSALVAALRVLVPESEVNIADLLEYVPGNDEELQSDEPKKNKKPKLLPHADSPDDEEKAAF